MLEKHILTSIFEPQIGDKVVLKTADGHNHVNLIIDQQLANGFIYFKLICLTDNNTHYYKGKVYNAFRHVIKSQYMKIEAFNYNALWSELNYEQL